MSTQGHQQQHPWMRLFQVAPDPNSPTARQRRLRIIQRAAERAMEQMRQEREDMRELEL